MKSSTVTTLLTIYGFLVITLTVFFLVNTPLNMILPLISFVWVSATFIVILVDRLEAYANQKTLERIKTGNYLVGWTYTEQEWQNFTNHEGRRSPWIAFDHLIYTVPTLTILAILTFLPGFKATETRQFLVFIAGLSVFMLYVAFVRILDATLEKKQHEKKADQVYFTLHGIYRGGVLETLPNLLSPKVVSGDPSVLHLEGYRDFGGSRNSTAYIVRVAIPQGRESEAKLLIQFYQSNSTEEREQLLQGLAEMRAKPEAVGSAEQSRYAKPETVVSVGLLEQSHKPKSVSSQSL
jgi:uncharacterized protein YhhL (DUF1145 family)